MTTAYFDAAGGLTAYEKPANNNTGIVKQALIIVEGNHKDNKGRVHDFPAYRVQRIVDNTNTAVASGIEIPLMLDHSKELVSGGELKKLGELNSMVECRVISEQDLPNPKMQHLVGKLGAFAKFLVKNRVEDVQSGLIKLLSPGIDLASDRIAEVSAVAFPAIQGPALFKRAEGFALFSVNYTEAKEQFGAIRRLKQEAQEGFDILFGVLRDIDALDENEAMGLSRDALKRKAAEDYYADLLEVLGLNEDIAVGTELQEELVLDPYARNLTPGVEYSEEEGDVVDLVPMLKTRRRNR